MHKRIILPVILLFVLIFAQIPAIAQQKQGSGFRVSPVREELTLNKGSMVMQKVRVTNLSPTKTVAQVIINDFDPADNESGQPRILMNPSDTTSGNSFKSIASTVNKITLEGRETKEITVTISIPQNANPGGYYGALRFADENDNSKSTVALAASVGTLYLVTVPGNLIEKLELVEFTAAKNESKGRFFINGGKMSIITRLKNTGNIHVKPFGKVEISNRGKVIEVFELNNVEPRANILPNSTRKFENYLKNQKWIGKYTVTANLGYGTSGGLITAKTYFWVIPSWIIIAAVVLLIALIVGGFLLYRRYKNKPTHHLRPRR